jgi:hypothetical protein
MVKPILLYGCEVWGFSNNDIIEKVHLKFCKLLLHLKSKIEIPWEFPSGKNHNFTFICIHFKLPDRTIILE